ncbi:MAG: hypothetical protein WC139_06890 [Candidatus Kapaibacterium sp.]
MENLFEMKFLKNEKTYSLKIQDHILKSNIALDIYLDPAEDNLISLYSENSHLQLQSCRYFIISNMLEEVIFYTESDNKISGLIISKKGDCSLYANVDRSTLAADFMNLNSEKLLSAVALSVIESE